MSTGIYLEDHPPRVRQFRPRGTDPTGCIVLHTAEGVMDTVGPDTGAENVAAFISNRSDFGSYHRLCDSDSVVKLVRFTQAAYGDGTGSNSWAIHISFACRTTDWARMSPERRAGFLRQGAEAVVEAMHFLRKYHGITVPIARITRAQSDDGQPGFITHGERDPGRRTDPGADFPWTEFFALIVQLLAPQGTPTPEPEPELTRGGRIDRMIRLGRAARHDPENAGRGPFLRRTKNALTILRSIKPRKK